MSTETTYRQSSCPHCGATIETRSHEVEGGDRVFGALPGRKTVHLSTTHLDGTVTCREVAKVRS